MLKNYIRLALRNMRKQAFYTSINVLSLSVGIACAALIFLFIEDELSFDHFHEKKNQLYQVVRQSHDADGTVYAKDPIQPMPLGAAMVADLPEVINYTRLDYNQVYVRIGEKYFEPTAYFADLSFFEMFSFPIVSGSLPQDPHSLVLTRSAAAAYFGAENPLGKTLEVRLGDNYYRITVSGLIEAPSPQSSFQFELFLPLEKLIASSEWMKRRTTIWHGTTMHTFIELAPQTDLAQLTQKLPEFRAHYYPDERAEMIEAGSWQGEGMPFSYALHPLTQMHRDASVSDNIGTTSSPRYAYLLAGIGLIILLIAGINFTTLAIARASSRLKEIGLRKVIGARRSQVMTQFFVEALLVSAFSFFLGIVLIESLLPSFNLIVNKDLTIGALFDKGHILWLAGASLLAGLLAGAYPAWILSRFQPVQAFRKDPTLGGSNRFTRNLVSLQFALSILLLISTLVIGEQIQFMKEKALGFEGEQVVSIPLEGQEVFPLLTRMRNAAAQYPELLSVSASNVSFGQNRSRIGISHEGQVYEPDFFHVEPNFLEALRMEVVTGRNFDPHIASDSLGAILVNERMAQTLGGAEKILHQPLAGYERRGSVQPRVVGIVKDFHFRSLEHAITPAIFSMNPQERHNFLLVRLAPTQLPQSLERLSSIWRELAPEVPFQFRFLDENMEALYQREERWALILRYAVILSMCIAGMGMLGLVALSVAGRSKEISIRKVLGASWQQILLLLSSEMYQRILWAFVIAAPVAGYLMYEWLTQYAYRIALGLRPFLITALLMGGITFVIIIYHTLKAARENPVVALAEE